MKHIRAFILGGLLVSGLVFAGSGSLPQIATAVIQRAHVNDIRSALYQDLVPRNGSGAATSAGGSLGTSTYKWLKARIESGYWAPGDIKIHHSYNGAVGPGEGWMLMDGDVINETNYDAEHGAGHWDTYVGTSPLDGKYLPNMSSKYTVGSATTTQTGSVAITFTGNASNQISVADHTHTYGSLALEWYKSNSGTKVDQVFGDSTPVGDPHYDLVKGASKNSISLLVGNSSTINGILGAGTVGPPNHSGTNPTELFTEGAAGGTTGAGGAITNKNIQPESLQVQYYMRIID